MRPLVILGAGGHGRVVADAARAAAMDIAGFLDDACEPGDKRGDWPVLGRDGRLDDAEFVSGHLFVVGIGDNAVRRERAKALAASGAEFATVCHPAATVAPDVRIGAGTVLFAGCVVNTGSVLGDFVVVNTRASVDHDAQIGDGVHVGPGAVLAGTVRCDAEAFVGSGAVVLPGISVGARALVGAGAVVTRDVLPDAQVVGVPAGPRR